MLSEPKRLYPLSRMSQVRLQDDVRVHGEVFLATGSQGGPNWLASTLRQYMWSYYRCVFSNLTRELPVALAPVCTSKIEE